MYIPFIYTFYKYIYKYIWTNQYDQCLSMVVLYIYRFFFACLSQGGMLSYGHLIESVNCMSWHASWAGDWMSITGWWQYWFRCSLYCHSALVVLTLPAAQLMSLTKFFFSCPFLIHSALVFTPLKGNKGCFVISYANTSGRCCKEMLLLLLECFSSPGCMIFVFAHVGTRV